MSDAPGNRMTASLQENLVTLLAYDGDKGNVVRGMLDVNLMDGDFKIVADRCVQYWNEYNAPPMDHTADLLADIIEDDKNRRAKSVTRILRGMVALSESVNGRFVLDQLTQFMRMQRVKATILESAELIQSNAQMSLPDIEAMWQKLLRERTRNFEPGITLENYREVMDSFEKHDDEFSMGIGALDKRGIRPARGTVTLLVAPAGRGKTWGLMHIGKQAMMDRKKVLHVSLEMDEPDVALRYYQMLMAIPKRGKDDINITSLKVELGEFTDIERNRTSPDTSLDSPYIAEELMFNLHERYGAKLADLRIKRFPGNTLTIPMLEAYLDLLEQEEGFIPDMLILDYIGIMKVDRKNMRLSVDELVVDYRAMCVRRNLAGLSAYQSSKAGELAKMVRKEHLSEAWSVVGHADIILTYSCTDLEFLYGLARIYVAKARRETDHFVVLITQAYAIGQFCLQSHRMRSGYDELLKTFAKSEGDDEADDSSDDDGPGDDDGD